MVWGYDYFGDVWIVDVIVWWLCEKVEDNLSYLKWLVMWWGVGYYFCNFENEQRLLNCVEI